MELVRFYHNLNNGECNVWFGDPFKFDGPLCNLPDRKDGKIIEVVGLTPYTVELEIKIDPAKVKTAADIVNWYYHDTSRMIDRLNEIAISEAA